MTLNGQNLVAWHNATSAGQLEKTQEYADKGFRPISLSVYGTPSSPRYASVMVKRAKVIEVRQFIDLTQSEYQAVFQQMSDQGLGPFIITATGPKDGALFAGSFRKMSKTPLTRSNLSKQEFIDLNIAQKDEGKILLWVDSFGTESAPRYCAIWGPNPDKVAWNIDAVDEDNPDLQQRFEAMRSVGARPTLVAVTPAGRVCRMFTDASIGKWDSRVNMTSNGYQERFSLNAENGLWPIRVSASGAGSSARFAAIFATREEIAAREFRAAGTGGVAAIDQKMEAFIKDVNLRGCALAIGHGSRLLYARGYTFAEPGYDDIEPTTLFRQASVSKLYTALAIWKLIEEKKPFTLDTTLQSVLNLKQPNGSPPADNRFGDITVQHLLESRSGIAQGAIYDAVEASDAAGDTLPSSGLDIARLVASRMLTGAPGDKNNSSYGNTDYLLLSLIVQKKKNTPGFEEALSLLVLDPLHMTRTRGSRTRAGDQLAGEARHHMTVHDLEAKWKLRQLECKPSVKDPGRPLAPSHYGAWDYEFLDGCGGLSAAVVDVARLGAMLAAHSTNPVLPVERIDELFGLAYACRTQKTAAGKGSHGYHGLDWVKPVDVAKHQWTYSKGGWLPGQGTTITGTTGGYFYVYAQNGNTPPDATVKWLDEIAPIVEAHNWGNVDLFPQYGMPSFPSPSAASVKNKIQLSEPVRSGFKQLLESMALGFRP